jgi:predicted dehydrogenase
LETLSNQNALIQKLLLMKTPKKIKFAGISFDHMHIGDLLRQVHNHPDGEIVGLYDATGLHNPDVQAALKSFDLSEVIVFTDITECLKATQPDVAILCPATARHASTVEAVAPFGCHVLLEKPFASNLAEADRIIAAMKATGRELMVNWPLRWYPSHFTAKALCDEGIIGKVIQVHYYGGNRGPLRHGADKVERENSEKSKSWWYHKDAGGGSLLDYLGYGTTLGTWFHNGKAPIEVICMADEPTGLEVDEHSITVARYNTGLSKFETRWGTFSDPWTHQPQPKCGFVIVGTEGTISSYDFEETVRVQTNETPEGKLIPVRKFPENACDPITYFVDCLKNGRSPEGPLSIEIARIGQQIVDTAFLSAQQKKAIPLVG